MPLTPSVLWDPYSNDFLPGLESYITLQRADELLSRSLHGADWGPTPSPILDDVDDAYYVEPFAPPAEFVTVVETKRAALCDASQIITGLPLAGRRTMDDLPLAFPRTGLLDANRRPVSSTMIPQEVEAATAFLAAHLLKTRRDGSAEAAKLYASMTVGQSTTTFRAPTPDDLPRHVRKALVPFLLGGSTWAPVHP